VFDATQPRSRAFARQLSIFWVSVETGSRAIADPQCGFRVYPLAAAIAANARGDHMEFDLELPVRMVWAGIPVRNLPTRVRYLSADEGGVSHFHVVRDTARISWLHIRLALTAAGRRMFERIWPTVQRLNDLAIAGLPRSDIQSLQKILGRMRANLEAYVGETHAG